MAPTNPRGWCVEKDRLSVTLALLVFNCRWCIYTTDGERERESNTTELQSACMQSGGSGCIRTKPSTLGTRCIMLCWADRAVPTENANHYRDIDHGSASAGCLPYRQSIASLRNGQVRRIFLYYKCRCRPDHINQGKYTVGAGDWDEENGNVVAKAAPNRLFTECKFVVSTIGFSSWNSDTW